MRVSESVTELYDRPVCRALTDGDFPGIPSFLPAVGIAMPFFMAISHCQWLRTKEPVYLALTKAWSKGVAIFFATGAVSGTVLSFELGLLWPAFMEMQEPYIGMPFSWEGTAFFLEANTRGVFLYSWDRIHPWAHWGSGLIVELAESFPACL